MEQIQKVSFKLIKGKIVLTFFFIFFGFLPQHLALADDNYFNTLQSQLVNVQDQIDHAQSLTFVMNPNTMVGVIKAVNAAMSLFQKVTLAPLETEGNTLSNGLTEEQKGLFYQEILYGEQQNDHRGSLADLIYKSIVHYGIDPTETFDGKVTFSEIFKYTFKEVFYDFWSLFSFSRNPKNGDRLWRVNDRSNREKVARNLIVRLWDLFEIGRINENNDQLFEYIGEEIYKISQEAKKLRAERFRSENLAMGVYGLMLGLNLFEPQVLPFVHSDFVGWFTDGAWGSSLVSGSFLIFFYGSTLVTKYLTRTQKTFRLLSDLVFATLYLNKEDASAGSQTALKEAIRKGEGTLGKHKQRMKNAGYSDQAFENENNMEDDSNRRNCKETILKQLFR